MFDDLKALVKKCSFNIILHICNNTFNKPGRLILDKILSIKNFIISPVYEEIILIMT